MGFSLQKVLNSLSEAQIILLWLKFFLFFHCLNVNDLNQECRLSFISLASFQNLLFSCQALENIEIEDIHTIVVFGDILYDDFLKGDEMEFPFHLLSILHGGEKICPNYSGRPPSIPPLFLTQIVLHHFLSFTWVSMYPSPRPPPG